MPTMKIIRDIRRRRYRCRGNIDETEILFNPSKVSRRLLPMVREVRKRLLATFRRAFSRKRLVSLGLKRMYVYSIRFKRTVCDSWYCDREAFVNIRGSVEEIERTIAHECTHAILQEIASANVPRWLEEGLACLMSDRTSLPSAGGDAFTMNLARLGRKKRGFWHGPARAAARYSISRYAVKHLVDRWGLPRLIEILVALEHHTADRVLKRHTGLTVRALDDRIHEKMVRDAAPEVVIVNRSLSRSVVLQYEKQGHPAPYVWGAFTGATSRKLCATAHRIGAPIVVMPRLTRALTLKPLRPGGAFIPQRYYKAVASVIAFSRKMDGYRTRE